MKVRNTHIHSHAFLNDLIHSFIRANIPLIPFCLVIRLQHFLPQLFLLFQSQKQKVSHFPLTASLNLQKCRRIYIIISSGIISRHFLQLIVYSESPKLLHRLKARHHLFSGKKTSYWNVCRFSGTRYNAAAPLREFENSSSLWHKTHLCVCVCVRKSVSWCVCVCVWAQGSCFPHWPIYFGLN